MAFLLHFLLLVSVCFASNLPIIDLGYERHQAFSFNVRSTLNLQSFYKADNMNRALWASTTLAISAMLRRR
jgi:hypothetical protein